jgi:hypothetical protein
VKQQYAEQRQHREKDQVGPDTVEGGRWFFIGAEHGSFVSWSYEAKDARSADS